jgi:hypothetical protein
MSDEVNSMTRILSVRGLSGSGRALVLAVAVASVVIFAGVAQASATTFNPAKIISDDNMRAYDCLSKADIQAFLATQKGPLKSLSFPRHDKGTTDTASAIISEACAAWHISPKVMLTMLQKEQSLLTRTTLVTGSKGTLDWAVGMGCPDGSARLEKYRGFGNQIWYAAMRLDGYGEAGKSSVPVWHSGLAYSVGSVVSGKAKTVKLVAANISTYKLYVYNPSIGVDTKYYGDMSKAPGLSGNSNFWTIYRRFFGDTFANPAIRPVYRFRDKKTGGYLYTASPAVRYNLSRNSRYKYEVVSFSWNTKNAANSISVYRFMNRKTLGYQFTTSKAKYQSAASKKVWRYDCVAFKVSRKVASAVPAYRFDNKKTGLPLLTKSSREKKKFLTSKYRKTWRYKGVSFYLAP